MIADEVVLRPLGCVRVTNIVKNTASFFIAFVAWYAIYSKSMYMIQYILLE